jgi:hypothetical protein
MASTGPVGGSSADAPLRVAAARGVFVVPKTGRFFEVSPFGRAGAVLLLASIASAGLMFATTRTFSPEVPSRSPEWRRRSDAIGPVADRVAAGPVFLNPMRNRIPGYCPTPEDARRAL